MNPLKILFQRRGAYRDAFSTPQGKRVLADLKRFCGGDSPTFCAEDPNGRVSAYREGRREVYLRIVKMLDLSDEDMRHIQEDYPE